MQTMACFSVISQPGINTHFKGQFQAMSNSFLLDTSDYLETRLCFYLSQALDSIMWRISSLSRLRPTFDLFRDRIVCVSAFDDWRMSASGQNVNSQCFQ